MTDYFTKQCEEFNFDSTKGQGFRQKAEGDHVTKPLAPGIFPPFPMFASGGRCSQAVAVLLFISVFLSHS